MDAAFFAAAGIPTVVFGPHGAGAHAIDEWVDLSSVDVCREVLVRTAVFKSANQVVAYLLQQAADRITRVRGAMATVDPPTFVHTLLHRPRHADRMILQAESGVRRTTHCPGLPSPEEPVGIGFWRRYTTCYHPSTMWMLMMTWSFSSTVKYLIGDRGISAGLAFRL